MLDYIRNLNNIDYSDIHIREGKPGFEAGWKYSENRQDDIP